MISYKRPKYVTEAINKDRLRKKYWDQGCPNGADHLIEFKLLEPASNSVKEVICHDCGYSEK